MKKYIALLVTLIFVVSCSTVPLTGRRQLSLIGKSQLLPMAFAQYNKTLKTSKMSTNALYTSRVKGVGARIQKAVETYFTSIKRANYLKDYRWEFNVIDENKINAWCMPGGKVAFYTGIMPVCETEAGVAVVMGHEISHAIASHGGERMSQQLLTQLGGMGLMIALHKKPAMTQQLGMMAFTGLSTLGLLKFSRTHESEADKMGLIFMSMAGYDPHEAPKFWKRMETATTKMSKGRKLPAEFMSTHPHPKTRIAALNAQIPSVMKYYERAKRLK